MSIELRVVTQFEMESGGGPPSATPEPHSGRKVARVPLFQVVPPQLLDEQGWAKVLRVLWIVPSLTFALIRLHVWSKLISRGD